MTVAKLPTSDTSVRRPDGLGLYTRKYEQRACRTKRNNLPLAAVMAPRTWTFKVSMASSKKLPITPLMKLTNSTSAIHVHDEEEGAEDADGDRARSGAEHRPAASRKKALSTQRDMGAPV